jgi:hypothetical protein
MNFDVDLESSKREGKARRPSEAGYYCGDELCHTSSRNSSLFYAFQVVSLLSESGILRVPSFADTRSFIL